MMILKIFLTWMVLSSSFLYAEEHNLCSPSLTPNFKYLETPYLMGVLFKNEAGNTALYTAGILHGHELIMQRGTQELGPSFKAIWGGEFKTSYDEQRQKVVVEIVNDKSGLFNRNKKENSLEDIVLHLRRNDLCARDFTSYSLRNSNRELLPDIGMTLTNFRHDLANKLFAIKSFFPALSGENPPLGAKLSVSTTVLREFTLQKTVKPEFDLHLKTLKSLAAGETVRPGALLGAYNKVKTLAASSETAFKSSGDKKVLLTDLRDLEIKLEKMIKDPLPPQPQQQSSASAPQKVTAEEFRTSLSQFYGKISQADSKPTFDFFLHAAQILEKLGYKVESLMEFKKVIEKINGRDEINTFTREHGEHFYYGLWFIQMAKDNRPSSVFPELDGVSPEIFNHHS